MRPSDKTKTRARFSAHDFNLIPEPGQDFLSIVVFSIADLCEELQPTSFARSVIENFTPRPLARDGDAFRGFIVSIIHNLAPTAQAFAKGREPRCSSRVSRALRIQVSNRPVLHTTRHRHP